MLKLLVQSGEQQGKTFEVPEGVSILGRAPNNDFVLEDNHLSAEHAEIESSGDQYFFRDKRSTNGSRVRRGEQVFVLGGPDTASIALEHEDILLLGDPEKAVKLKAILLLEIPKEQGKVVSLRRITDVPQIEVSLEKEPERLSILYRATRSLTKVHEFDEVLDAVSDAAFELVSDATHLTIALSDENEPKKIVPVLARGRLAENVGETFPISRTVLNRVIKDRAALQIADAILEIGSKSVHGAKILSALGVPLWVGEDVRGALLMDNRDSPGMFAERDLELLTVLAGQAALAIENSRLLRRLKLAEERLQKENLYLKVSEERRRFKGIIGQSKAMAKVFEQISKVMDTRVTVAIDGETGTGKELVASMIHYQGNRRDKLFVAQNCAALPETLLESELFGHKKGAFTNAHEDKKGIFEIADNGTVFLDEVGEMTLSLQSKLLRVLQESEIRPIGASFSKKVDIRIISATNRNLEEEVSKGRFRKDLFYRLRVFPITLPPLRERKEDIILLANFFLKKYGEEIGRPMAGFSQEAVNLLSMYHWPGNVRELENEVQRIVIQGDSGGFVTPDILSSRVRQTEVSSSKLSNMRLTGATLKEMVSELEKAILIEALEAHNGNKTQTAASLGITREGLHKKLAKLKLN